MEDYMRAFIICLSLLAVACSGNKEKDKAPIKGPVKIDTNKDVCPAITPGIYQEYSKEGKPGNTIKYLKITKVSNGNFAIQLDQSKEELEVNGQEVTRGDSKAVAGCTVENEVKLIRYSIGGKNVLNGTIAPNEDGSLTLTNFDKENRKMSFRLAKIADVEIPKIDVCPVIAPAIYREFTKDGKPGNTIKYLKITKLANGNYVIQFDKSKEGLEVNGQEATNGDGKAVAGCVFENNVKLIRYSIGGKTVLNGTLIPNADASLTLSNTDSENRISTFRLVKVADVETPIAPTNPAQNCKNFVGKYNLTGEGTEVKSVNFSQVEDFQKIDLLIADGKTVSYSTKPVGGEEVQNAYCKDQTYINLVMSTENEQGEATESFWAFTIPLDAPDKVILTVTGEDKKPVMIDGKAFGPFTYQKVK